jgi:Flavodoxin
MKALVVYESMWGNTEEVARAIAAGLSESFSVEMTEVSSAPVHPGPEYSLIVVGGPTHAFSMSRPTTRADAHARGAQHGEDVAGVREWLERLPTAQRGQAVATFDTKVGKMRRLPGSAAKSAAKAASRHGYRRPVFVESFYVQDTEGPLLDGELDRATEWGREVAAAAGSTRA